MAIDYYALTSSFCLSIFYGFYLLVIKNGTHFKLLRFYLLTSVLLAMVLPLHSTCINLDFFMRLQHESQIQMPIDLVDPPVVVPGPTKINWMEILLAIYRTVALVLIARIAVQTFGLWYRCRHSERLRHGRFWIIYNRRNENSFSFFHWIFIPKDNPLEEEIDPIILHEKIHASQYHSIDLILFELLSAVMWFNPLVWKMKASIQLVHEYLADEGVLSTGIDKLKYQALLINQVAEEKLICISSKFNHSLIKKRMIMMTKRGFSQRTKVRVFALLPITASLFFITACFNGFVVSPAKASTKLPSQGLGLQAAAPYKHHPASVRDAKDSSKNEQVLVKVLAQGTKKQGELNYILNGVSVKNLDGVPSDSIESVNVLKDDHLVIARTKSFVAKQKAADAKAKDGSKALIILDGIERPDLSPSDIRSEDVSTVEVVKNQGGEGIIKITTKK